MAFHTKTYEAYGNIRMKPNQPCNYFNICHKSKVNIFGQYIFSFLLFWEFVKIHFLNKFEIFGLVL